MTQTNPVQIVKRHLNGKMGQEYKQIFILVMQIQLPKYFSLSWRVRRRNLSSNPIYCPASKLVNIDVTVKVIFSILECH